MKKNEAIEEFDDILHEAVKNYGEDSFSIRKEIWELYLETLHQNGEITSYQKRTWLFPSVLREDQCQIL